MGIGEERRLQDLVKGEWGFLSSNDHGVASSTRVGVFGVVFLASASLLLHLCSPSSSSLHIGLLDKEWRSDTSQSLKR